MSLTESFFTERDAVLDKFRTQGYISIEDFEEEYSLKLDELFEGGFLTPRTIISTTYLYDYHVNNKGKRFMKEIKELELILVKPNSANKLADELKKSLA